MLNPLHLNFAEKNEEPVGLISKLKSIFIIIKSK